MKRPFILSEATPEEMAEQLTKSIYESPYKTRLSEEQIRVLLLSFLRAEAMSFRLTHDKGSALLYFGDEFIAKIPAGHAPRLRAAIAKAEGK